MLCEKLKLDRGGFSRVSLNLRSFQTSLPLHSHHGLERKMCFDNEFRCELSLDPLPGRLLPVLPWRHYPRNVIANAVTTSPMSFRGSEYPTQVLI